MEQNSFGQHTNKKRPNAKSNKKTCKSKSKPKAGPLQQPELHAQKPQIQNSDIKKDKESSFFDAGDSFRKDVASESHHKESLFAGSEFSSFISSESSKSSDENEEKMMDFVSDAKNNDAQISSSNISESEVRFQKQKQSQFSKITQKRSITQITYKKYMGKLQQLPMRQPVVRPKYANRSQGIVHMYKINLGTLYFYEIMQEFARVIMDLKKDSGIFEAVSELKTEIFMVYSYLSKYSAGSRPGSTHAHIQLQVKQIELINILTKKPKHKKFKSLSEQEQQERRQFLTPADHRYYTQFLYRLSQILKNLQKSNALKNLNKKYRKRYIENKSIDPIFLSKQVTQFMSHLYKLSDKEYAEYREWAKWVLMAHEKKEKIQLEKQIERQNKLAQIQKEKKEKEEQQRAEQQRALEAKMEEERKKAIPEHPKQQDQSSIQQLQKKEDDEAQDRECVEVPPPNESCLRRKKGKFKAKLNPLQRALVMGPKHQVNQKKNESMWVTHRFKGRQQRYLASYRFTQEYLRTHPEEREIIEPLMKKDEPEEDEDSDRIDFDIKTHREQESSEQKFQEDSQNSSTNSEVFLQRQRESLMQHVIKESLEQGAVQFKRSMPRSASQNILEEGGNHSLFKNELVKQKRNKDENYLQAKREEAMNSRYLLEEFGISTKKVKLETPKRVKKEDIILDDDQGIYTERQRGGGKGRGRSRGRKKMVVINNGQEGQVNNLEDDYSVSYFHDDSRPNKNKSQQQGVKYEENGEKKIKIKLENDGQKPRKSKAKSFVDQLLMKSEVGPHQISNQPQDQGDGAVKGYNRFLSGMVGQSMQTGKEPNLNLFKRNEERGVDDDGMKFEHSLTNKIFYGAKKKNEEKRDRFMDYYLSAGMGDDEEGGMSRYEDNGQNWVGKNYQEGI